MLPLLDLDARPVIAHRGASALAPENTLPAFKLALGLGADALELDVRLTADGVPVVLHDLTLDRTTDAGGPLAGYTLDVLRRVDAGAGFTPDGVTFPFRGRGITVPTLAEVLAAFPSTPLLIEIKEPAAQRAVAAAVLAAGAADRCVMASELAAAIAAIAPPLLRGASGPEIAQLWRAVMLRRRLPMPNYRLLSVPVRHRGLPVPTSRFVAAARSLGVPVHVWTVDRPVVARRLWKCGVSGIVTNSPDVIQASRR